MWFVLIAFGVLLSLVVLTHRTEPESGLSPEVEALLQKDGIDPSGRRDWSQINYQ
jgi:hypothetical protein